MELYDKNENLILVTSVQTWQDIVLYKGNYYALDSSGSLLSGERKYFETDVFTL